MITRIKRFLCSHDYQMKKFNLGSLLGYQNLIETYYLTCEKCGDMKTDQPYRKLNPDFKMEQQ